MGTSSHLLEAVQAVLATFPSCDGGFTISVQPIPVAHAHRQDGKKKRESGTPNHVIDREKATALGPEPAERPSSQTSSWRPAGRAVLSLKEVAAALGLGRTTIYRLIKDGRVRVIQVGHRTLVPIEVVETILETGLLPLANEPKHRERQQAQD